MLNLTVCQAQSNPTDYACLTGPDIPLTRYYGRLLMMKKSLCCALLLGILGFPAFWVFHNYSDNYLYVCLALALPFGVVYAAVFGTMSSLFSDSFDPSVRYSAISFVYQFSGIFAAGLTPMVATMLVAWNGGEPWYLCAYLGSAGLISAACTLWIRHLNRKGFPPALPVEGETPVSEPLMEGESA